MQHATRTKPWQTTTTTRHRHIFLTNLSRPDKCCIWTDRPYHNLAVCRRQCPRSKTTTNNQAGTAQLHAACHLFLKEIQGGSLATINSLVEGATSTTQDIRGELVHIDGSYAVLILWTRTIIAPTCCLTELDIRPIVVVWIPLRWTKSGAMDRGSLLVDHFDI
jgi:hypothetical protein